MQLHHQTNYYCKFRHVKNNVIDIFKDFGLPKRKRKCLKIHGKWIEPYNLFKIIKNNINLKNTVKPP